MQLTQEQFFRSMQGLTRNNARVYLPFLNSALQEYGINTPLRVAHFLGQLAHESGDLRFFEEIWGNTPAQLRYKNRADLGNTHPDAIAAAKWRGFADVGRFYKGYGAIQTTGFFNIKRAGEILGLDTVHYPELLAKPEHAFRSAALFWRDNGLNTLADKDNLRAVTRKINGGFNGLDDRIIKTAKAKRALGI